MRSCWIFILVLGLLLTGCGNKETATETGPTPAPPAKSTAVEQVKKSADEVAKQATKMVEAGTQLIKDTGVAAEETAKEAVVTAKENLDTATEVVQKKAAAVSEQVKNEGTELLESLQKSTNDSINKGKNLLADTETIQEILVIKNKNGNVSLPHAQHGKSYGCPSCHSESPPGPFELGKDKAHAMCKDCHKEKGGPLKCNGCHKK
jgi:hypothetical protein